MLDSTRLIYVLLCKLLITFYATFQKLFSLQVKKTESKKTERKRIYERITVIEICHRKSMNAYSSKDDPTNLSKSPSIPPHTLSSSLLRFIFMHINMHVVLYPLSLCFTRLKFACNGDCNLSIKIRGQQGR